MLVRLVALLVSICCSVSVTMASAQDSIVPESSSDQLSEASRMEIAEKLRIQPELVQTAQISFLYYLCGKKDVSREQMNEFLDALIASAGVSTVPDDIRSLIDEGFPGRGGPRWQRGTLTIDGAKARERLHILRPTSDEVVYTRESVFDDHNASMLLTDSGQATLFGPEIRFSMLGIGDIACFASPHIVDLPMTRQANGRLLFDANDDSDTKYVLDPEQHVVEHFGTDTSDRYALHWQPFDGVLLPQLSIEVHYKKGFLYEFAVLSVDHAVINHPIGDSFELAVPKGTVISDQRPHRGDRPMAWTAKTDVPSIVEFVEAMDNSLNPSVAAPKKTPAQQQPQQRITLWVAGAVVIALLFAVSKRILRNPK